MRKLTDHKTNGVNESLEITVMDEPGSGGASHRYDITGFETSKNPSATDAQGYMPHFSRLPIVFQNGGLQEVGCANGVSHEALLAIVIDRLKSYQSGPYPSRENAIALTKIEEGLMWLQKRTLDRVRRGVEGTSQK